MPAVGSPSADLANRLNALFGPCGLVSIMAVCVAIKDIESRTFKRGLYSFTVMEWLCNVGYTCFSWNNNIPSSSFQNIMHLIVTVLVIIFSIMALVLIAVSAHKVNHKPLGSWAILCLTLMMVGSIGSDIMPKYVFGLFERFSTFSIVIFNSVLGIYLYVGKFNN